MKLKLVTASVLAAAALTVAPSSHATTGYPAYDEFLAGVQYMADKYHLGAIDVSMKDLDLAGQTVVARAVGSHITVNSAMALYPARWDALHTEGVRTGWIPGGCSAPRTAAIHESAHVLDYLTGESAHSEAIAAYGGQQVELSGYSFDDNGIVDLNEALANAMVAVECGTASPLESDLHRMLTT